MRDFPNGGHDDGPDALEMALRPAGELLDDPGPQEFYVSDLRLEYELRYGRYAYY